MKTTFDEEGQLVPQKVWHMDVICLSALKTPDIFLAIAIEHTTIS